MKSGLVVALVVLAVGAAEAQEGDMALRIFDVSRIAAAREPSYGPALGPEMPYFGYDAEEQEAVAFLEIDALADLIRDTIDPDAWDEGGEVMAQEGGILTVIAPPGTLRKIEALLAELETAASRRVLFSVEVFTFPASSYAEVAKAADPAKLDMKIYRGSRIDSASVEAYPGVRASVKVLNRVRYVGDYDVEIAQGANISDPIVHTGSEGFVMDLVAHPTSDGSRIVVESLLQEGRFDRPFRTLELGTDEEYFAEPFRSAARRRLGTLELPVYRQSDAFSTAVVRPGGTFTVPILTGDKVVVFVVRTEILGRRSPDWILDVGILTRRPQLHYFGFPMQTRDAEYLNITIPRICQLPDDAPPLLCDVEVLLDLIHRRVRPEYWEEEGTIAIHRNDTLYMNADPKVRSEVGKFVADREGQALQPIRIELQVLSVADPLEAGAGKLLPTGSGLLFAGKVATLPGRRASLMAGNVMNYIADYDVEVAQEARIADPIIGQSFEGLVANLTPLLSPKRTMLRLDIALLLSLRTETRIFDSGTQFLGPLDALAENRRVFNTSIEVPAGGGYILDAGQDPERPDRRIALFIQTRVE